MSATVLLLRHGHTELNGAGALRGRLDPPLTRIGLAQARALGKRLHRRGLTAVHSSPLSRTLDTARQVAEPHGLSPQVHGGFIDLDYGRWAGIPLHELSSTDQGIVARWRRNPAVPLPGAEDPARAQDRAFEALLGVTSEGAGCVAIVSHEAIIQLLLCRILDLPLPSHRGLVVETAAVSELERHGDAWRVHLVNSTWHLDAPVERGEGRSGRRRGARAVRMRQTSAGGCVVRGGRILILKTLSGEWILPKGELEEGEAPADAARREVAEEAGIEVTVLRSLHPTSFTREAGGHRIEKTVYWYLMASGDATPHPDPAEFATAEWVAPDEAMRRLRWDDLRDLVAVAFGILNDDGP